MIKKVALLLTLPMLFAFGSKHSTLDASHSKKDGEVVFQFKIKANDGMQLTHQAPWSVSFDQAKDLGLKVDEKGKFTSKSYDEKLPGFTVKAKPTAKSGTFNYKVKAFVCTLDKKRCYPQTHKGTINWKS